MHHQNLNDHLAPPKMLPRTPKGCEYPWLGTPAIEQAALYVGMQEQTGTVGKYKWIRLGFYKET